jgi:hypothetical protein
MPEVRKRQNFSGDSFLKGKRMSEEETNNFEAQESPPEDKPKSAPALVINVQTWATPIVGLVMLVVGLLAGYFIRPLIPTQEQAETPIAAAPAATIASTNSSPDAASATQQPANLQQVMDLLIPQVKHFRGDPNAPVTFIEFSDFQ